MMRWLGRFLVTLTCGCALLVGATAALGALLPPDEVAFTAPPRGIYLVDVRTGNVRPLMNGRHIITASPNWMPARDQLVFAITPGFAARDQYPAGIYRSDPYGRDPQLIQPGLLTGALRLSADGRYAAYADLSRVYILDTTDGSRAFTIPVSAPGYVMGSVAWAPDGQWLAYTSGLNGRREAYLFDLTSAESQHFARRLALDAGESIFAFPFAWSPDSTQLLFFGAADQRKQFARVDRMSGAITWLDVIPEGMTTWAIEGLGWSSDARHVAFGVPNGAITIFDVDTAQIVVMLGGEYPIWSPDGMRVIYMRERADRQTELVTYDLASASERVLVVYPYRFQDYHWRP